MFLLRERKAFSENSGEYTLRIWGKWEISARLGFDFAEFQKSLFFFGHSIKNDSEEVNKNGLTSNKNFSFQIDFCTLPSQGKT